MAWLTKRGSYYYIKYSLAGKKRRIATGLEGGTPVGFGEIS